MILSTTYVTLCVAICLSAVAAYFSVLGLMEIFSAAPQSIMVMAIILEVTKVSTAYWAHINWKILPYTIKTYLVLAVLILMAITSLGIYGFLAKAHITQKNEISIVYDTEINKLNADIASREENIKGIDNQIGIINGVIETAASKGWVTKSLQLNKKYAKDKQELVDKKTVIRKEILTLEQQKIGIQSKKTESEAKIGPLKYVVNLLYGDATPEQLNSSVRWLIIILVAVFDPLAIFLLIGTGYVLRYMDNPLQRKPVSIRTFEAEDEDFAYTEDHPKTNGSAAPKPEKKKAIIIKKASPT